jgi:hypothetical protein
MSNYVQSTNFATKDALSSGDPLKIVKGTEINTEFNNIATAVATKADLVSPTFTGTVVAPAITGNLTGNVTGNVTGNLTGNADTVTNGVTTVGNQSIAGNKTFTGTTGIGADWTLFQSGSSLVFSYQGTPKFAITSAGAVTAVDNITAYGTV